MESFKVPSVFIENKDIYEKFASQTIPHTKGYFILAPSGAGKTHFITRQREKHWIDGDLLWFETRAMPTTEWWNEGLSVIKEVEARCDCVTAEAKRQGLWIMGASANWLVPDAIVIPPWKTNVAQIQKRQETNYDGGLTTSHLKQLKLHHKEMKEVVRKNRVPIFKSVDEAAKYIESIYNNS